MVFPVMFTAEQVDVAISLRIPARSQRPATYQVGGVAEWLIAALVLRHATHVALALLTEKYDS